MKLSTGALGRRARTIAAAAAVLLTASLAGTVTATGASADPIGSCAMISKFTMTFSTGDDDLRYNSELAVGIIVQDIHVPIPLTPIFGPFGDYSTTVKADVTFATTGQTVNSCLIRGQRITLVSHPAWPQGADNWDMNSFSIMGFTSGGVAKYQHGSGNAAPRFRFTESRPTMFLHDQI
jgi:hypothetical protein